MTTQTMFSGKPGDSQCECADKGCPIHTGRKSCKQIATTVLHRVDMEDLAGVAFCDACAEDAYECGLYTDEAYDASY